MLWENLNAAQRFKLSDLLIYYRAELDPLKH
jgi:hypothetical protein